MAQLQFDPLRYTPKRGGIASGIQQIGAGVASLAGTFETAASNIKSREEAQQVYKGVFDEYMAALSDMGIENPERVVARYFIKPASKEDPANVVKRLGLAGEKIRTDIIAPHVEAKKQQQTSGKILGAMAGSPERQLEAGGAVQDTSGLGLRTPAMKPTLPAVPAAETQLDVALKSGATPAQIKESPAAFLPKNQAEIQKQQTAQAKKLWDMNKQERDLKFKEDKAAFERSEFIYKKMKDKTARKIKVAEHEIKPLQDIQRNTIESITAITEVLKPKLEAEIKKIQKLNKGAGADDLKENSILITDKRMEIKDLALQEMALKNREKTIGQRISEILKEAAGVEGGRFDDSTGSGIGGSTVKGVTEKDARAALAEAGIANPNQAQIAEAIRQMTEGQ